ncbi:hypothetical protein R3P38DRAFT_2797430 [Favolaschia claudopus]|uniref:Ricin B lectin domain-containing protein n=1 Tax=Favolaschia claudopus TaxID=2862362 RepID=A0AAW0A2V0_9AGAR
MDALNGLYTITNVQSQTRLDLSREKSSLKMWGLVGKKADGEYIFYVCHNLGYSSTIGTKVVAWTPHQPTDGKAYGNQVWKIQPKRGEGLFTVYTIANVKSGTYLEAVGSMDMEPGFSTGHGEGAGKDGVQVTCSKANEVAPSSQEWQLFKDPVPVYPGTYAIVHVASHLLHQEKPTFLIRANDAEIMTCDQNSAGFHRISQNFGRFSEISEGGSEIPPLSLESR